MLTQIFEKAITAARQDVERVTEVQAGERVTPSGWTRKQVLGHLIDSCLNNHQRFVRAAIDGEYTGPDYLQAEWVGIHGYERMTWPRLVNYWILHNELLLEVVRNIPEDRYGAICHIDGDAPVTLEFLINDYLNHLAHHMNQIRGSGV